MLTRTPVARVLRTMAVRRVSSDATRTAGATGSSREFSKKEKAHEDQYVRQKEAAAFEKLRKELEAQKEKVNKLQKKVDEAHANLNDKKN